MVNAPPASAPLSIQNSTTLSDQKPECANEPLRPSDTSPLQWEDIRARDRIINSRSVSTGDTAAGIYQKLGSKLSSDLALREKHRRDLELFKMKLEERRKRSFRR